MSLPVYYRSPSEMCITGCSNCAVCESGEKWISCPDDTANGCSSRKGRGLDPAQCDDTLCRWSLQKTSTSEWWKWMKVPDDLGKIDWETSDEAPPEKLHCGELAGYSWAGASLEERSL